MDKFNLTEWTLKHKSLVYFFIILIFFTGIYSYLKLGRMEDPDFTIRQMVVTVAWPGATAQQIEEQVTDKIEQKLQDTQGLDYLQSYSVPGRSYIFISLDFSVNKEDIQPTWLDVRNMVNDIKHTLPEGVIGPFYNDKYSDVFGSVYAITGDGFSYEDLRSYAEKLRRAMLDIDSVKKVELLGVQPEKIFIELESSKLAKLNIDPNTLISTLQDQNAMAPAGMVDTSTDNVYLRVTGMFDNIQDIEDLPIRTGNSTIRLGDIARVERGYADPTEPKMFFNGQPAVGLAVSMEEGGNIIEMGKDLAATVGRLQTDFPLGLEIQQVADQPKVVKDSINEFVLTLLIAIFVILLVCFWSLGVRTGAVVGMSIPLVIAGVFVFMELTSIDLHRISLGALIIAMGLLVDDAIIILESMTVKIEQGWERTKAACYAYSNTAKPMLSGTLVTCAGFIPVAYSKGTAAEYVGTLFWVITAALVLSWLVAGTATPLIGSKMIKVRHHDNGNDFDLYDTKFYRAFKVLLNRCLHHRSKVLILTMVIFLVSVASLQLLKQDFFPTSVRPEIIVDLKLPEGSSLQATDEQSHKFAQSLQDDPDIVSYSYYVGQSAPRFLLSFEPVLPATNFAQFIIVTNDLDARGRVAQRLDELISHSPAVHGHYRFMQTGIPAQYPVALRVSGPDHDQVRNIAARVQEYMNQQPYLRDVNMNWNEKSKVVKLEIDQDKARILGVNSQSLAYTLQAEISGISMAEFREENKTINMMFRLDAQKNVALSDLKDLNIPLSSGQYVPLDQIANISYDAEEGLIWRRDLKPTITVQAEITPDVTGNDATRQVYNGLQELRDELPHEYSIEIGGTLERSMIATENLIKAVPLMVVAILILLMIQLQSMSKMFITLMTAPLGIIGAAPALLLSGSTLCFVTYCGFLALAGIIIRNSIILIDQIDKQLAASETQWHAIINAAVLRFRPIMLTAAAAVLGMVPLMTSLFWGPLAITIASGLIAATLLTLIVLPTMYAAWYKVEPEER